jgi:predicted dehydrogenase
VCYPVVISGRKEKELSQPLFRLGVIGVGEVTSSMHLPGALASEWVVVAALVDSVIGRARTLARDYGIRPRIASRVEEIIDCVDGVVIATPNHTHRAIAVACLRAGIPCLVEKPLATRVADAEEMCATAEQANKVLAVGYTTRFRDEVVLLNGLLQSRYFGAIRRFHYQEGTIGGWSPASGYIADREAAGGGVLTVVGTHFIDRMLHWFGYPDSCNLVDDSKGGPEAHCLASFHYSTWGAPFEGTLLLSKTVQLKPGLVIDTELGSVIFPMGRSPLYFEPRDAPGLRIVLARRGRRIYSLAKDDAQLEIENFVDACRGKAAPMVDGYQALLSVRLLNELYHNRSPLNERWMETPAVVAV